jgi:hypothetical protein
MNKFLYYFNAISSPKIGLTLLTGVVLLLFLRGCTWDGKRLRRT